MPSPFSFRLTTHTPDETEDLARGLAPVLSAGDVLLLEGQIGAGKTHFARCLIRALQGDAAGEDIPSPTFTLVQTYDTQAGEVWHADLYRLTHVDEVLELGLEDAFRTAICLIEWPDRLGDLAPPDALVLSLAVTGENSRSVTLTGTADWGTRLKPLQDTARVRNDQPQ